MPKQIAYAESARRSLEAGMNKLADAVRVTLVDRGAHTIPGLAGPEQVGTTQAGETGADDGHAGGERRRSAPGSGKGARGG